VGSSLSTDDPGSFDQRIDPIGVKAFIRIYLQLPTHASDDEIRAVLFKRDDGLLAWYDSRMRNSANG
jgi:hypothetical protein